MRIDERNPALAVGPKRAPSTARAEGRTGSVAGPDKVSLSNDVQRMRQARAERLDQIKAALDAGDYAVDLDLLAETIVGREG